jgi:peptidoglycan/xylan/chitin deacetylase (PgdA/CDA1 family)
MRILTRWFRPLSLDDFVHHMDTGTPFEAGSCLVTFDDGWSDTFAEAWPILRKHGIPAAVFLPVDFIGSSATFWQERLGQLLFEAWRLAREDEGFASAARAALSEFALDQVMALPKAGVKDAIVDLVRAQKHAHAEIAARAIAVLERLLGPNAAPPADTFMTWDQAREMSRAGVAFGGHGVTHRMLTNLPPDEIRSEVRGARSEIARRLEVPVTAFCYPNGDWTPPVAAAVRDEGFAVAFSTIPGFAEASSERYGIRRVNVHEDMTRDPAMFLAMVLGAL